MGDSDATVLFSVKPVLTGGSKRTVEFARKHRRPHLHLYAGDNAAADKLKAFTEEHRVKVLNVAGPRASKEPGVGEFVVRTFKRLLVSLPCRISAAIPRKLLYQIPGKENPDQRLAM